MILSSIVLVGCLASNTACQLQVPNIEVCRDKGELGARCNFTNVDKPREIAKEDWDKERFGQFCLNEEGFAKNQKFVEQACELVKDCNVEEIKRVYSKLVQELQGAGNN